MAWNRSVPKIDKVNKTINKRPMWCWPVLGLIVVFATIAIVQSIPAKKAVVPIQKDVKWECQVVDVGGNPCKCEEY